MNNGHKRNVLFLVHCEEMFRKYFPDNMFALRLRKSAMAKKYSDVILLNSELTNGPEDGIIAELCDLNLDEWCWSWGYELGYCYDSYWSDITDDEPKWTIESKGHEATWVPVEIRDRLAYFQNSNIYIGGGCDSECLADWESVLEYLDLPYTRVKGLIY